MSRLGVVWRLWIVGLVLSLAVPSGGARGEDAAPPHKRSERIIGGTVARAGAWPWQVAILTATESDNYQAQFCGGTLIASRWVLTAAHCLVDDYGAAVAARTIHVLVGTQSLSSGGQRVPASRVIVHDGYNDESMVNDIALIELSRAVTQRTIGMVTTANERTLTAPGVRAVFVGWGDTDIDPEVLEGAEDLLQVTMPIVSDALCQAVYDPFLPTQLCAGERLGGKDTCQGDSGGPLFVPNPAGGYLLGGVVSYGDGCAQAGKYGVYTRVSRFQAWISAHTSPTRSSPVLVVDKDGYGSGTVTSSPAGISCGFTCTAAFQRGQSVRLTARAGANSTFAGWSGDCSGSRTAVSVLMSASRSCSARFDSTISTPANDDFADAVVLAASATGSTTGSSVGAGGESGEPRHGDHGGRRAVWWRWTAPRSGAVSFSTEGSDYDTVMAIYSGSRLSALTEIGSNDDDPESEDDVYSLVDFTAVAGRAYYIAVDGYHGDTGAISLSWR